MTPAAPVGHGPGPDVSILIVNWNSRDRVARCLDSVAAAAGSELSHEVILVDNASVDRSRETLAGRADIDLVTNDANLGYTPAINQAYRRSRASSSCSSTRTSS